MLDQASDFAPTVEEVMHMAPPAKFIVTQAPRPRRRILLRRAYWFMALAWVSGFLAGLFWYGAIQLAKFIVRVL